MSLKKISRAFLIHRKEYIRHARMAESALFSLSCVWDNKKDVPGFQVGNIAGNYNFSKSSKNVKPGKDREVIQAASIRRQVSGGKYQEASIRRQVSGGKYQEAADLFENCMQAES